MWVRFSKREHSTSLTVHLSFNLVLTERHIATLDLSKHPTSFWKGTITVQRTSPGKWLAYDDIPSHIWSLKLVILRGPDGLLGLNFVIVNGL